MRTPIDIRLYTGETSKVKIDGIDYSRANYLLLELRGGRIARFIVGKGPELSLRQRIVLWIAGGR